MPLVRPELLPVTRRLRVIQEVMRYVGQLSNGRYDVVRGAVNWSEYSWAGKKKYAVAVLADESTFLRVQNRMALTLEFMTQLASDALKVDDPELDQMYSDGAEVFFHMVDVSDPKTRDPDDPALPLVFKLDSSTDTALEVSDVTLKIQGVVVTAFLEF